jgi:hypothetical protein
LCAKFVFCCKEILPKTSGNSALTSFFQTSKNLKLEGGFGDLQEAQTYNPIPEPGLSLTLSNLPFWVPKDSIVSTEGITPSL